jgi:hypothetical protein
LTALKETVLPDFVLNLTVVAFLTVFTATNLTFFFCIKMYDTTAAFKGYPVPL